MWPYAFESLAHGVMESRDFGFRIADFGYEQLKSDQILNKNPQSKHSNTPKLYEIESHHDEFHYSWL